MTMHTCVPLLGQSVMRVDVFFADVLILDTIPARVEHLSNDSLPTPEILEESVQWR